MMQVWANVNNLMYCNRYVIMVWVLYGVRFINEYKELYMCAGYRRHTLSGRLKGGRGFEMMVRKYHHCIISSLLSWV